jgi:hypothetical protein
MTLSYPSSSLLIQPNTLYLPFYKAEVNNESNTTLQMKNIVITIVHIYFVLALVPVVCNIVLAYCLTLLATIRYHSLRRLVQTQKK